MTSFKSLQHYCRILKPTQNWNRWKGTSPDLSVFHSVPGVSHLIFRGTESENDVMHFFDWRSKHWRLAHLSQTVRVVRLIAESLLTRLWRHLLHHMTCFSAYSLNPGKQLSKQRWCACTQIHKLSWKIEKQNTLKSRLNSKSRNAKWPRNWWKVRERSLIRTWGGHNFFGYSCRGSLTIKKFSFDTSNWWGTYFRKEMNVLKSH